MISLYNFVNYSPVFQYILYGIAIIIAIISIFKSVIKYSNEKKDKQLIEQFYDNDGEEKHPFGIRNYNENSEYINSCSGDSDDEQCASYTYDDLNDEENSNFNYGEDDVFDLYEENDGLIEKNESDTDEHNFRNSTTKKHRCY